MNLKEPGAVHVAIGANCEFIYIIINSYLVFIF